MSLEKQNRTAYRRRVKRVRFKICKNIERNNLFRVSVFRSLNHVYAQLIDTHQGKTLASATSLGNKDTSSLKRKDAAFHIGKELAAKARALGVERVVFDRGACIYHGRVRAVAEGLREGGLQV